MNAERLGWNVDLLEIYLKWVRKVYAYNAMFALLELPLPTVLAPLNYIYLNEYQSKSRLGVKRVRVQTIIMSSICVRKYLE